MTCAPARDERGQATVELVAFLPLAFAVTLAAASIVSGQGAREHAGEAAHAGAMALLLDEDARAAARDALPARDRTAAHISVAGRRVTVALPASGLLGRLLPRLESSASADAGPKPTP